MNGSEEGEWIAGKIWVPGGSHLAQSKATPGLDRALLFIEGIAGTAGPAEFLPDNPNEARSETGLPEIPSDDALKLLIVAAAALATGVVVTVVIVKNGSRIKAWWNDLVVPAFMVGFLKLAGVNLEDFIDTETKMAAIGPVTTTAFSDEVETVVEDLHGNMTNEEAQQRLLTVLMAAAIIAEQMRALRNAHIGDDDLNALRCAMSKLATGQVVDGLNGFLEHAALNDDEASRAFFEVFRGGRTIDGVYEPVNLKRIEDALRLDPSAQRSLGRVDDEDDDGADTADQT